MSVHINFLFFVYDTLLKMILAVIQSTVGFVTSPGKLIKFPPTVSSVRCVSAFCGCILTTIIPYVTVIPDLNSPLYIKKIIFVTAGILVLTPCASRTISFAIKFSQMALVGSLIICLYSRDAPVVGSMTILG